MTCFTWKISKHFTSYFILFLGKKTTWKILFNLIIRSSPEIMTLRSPKTPNLPPLSRIPSGPQFSWGHSRRRRVTFLVARWGWYFFRHRSGNKTPKRLVLTEEYLHLKSNGTLFNGPRCSVSCDRAIRSSGFFKARSVGPAGQISWIDRWFTRLYSSLFL